MAADDLAPALLTVLDASPGSSIEGLRRLSGGASRETWSFDLVTPDERTPLILQRQRPGAAGAAAMAIEAAVVRAAATERVPVPGVVATDDGSVLGAAGMIVDRLEGETIARKLLRDDEWEHARGVLCRQSAEALAGIHRIERDAVPGLAATDPLEQQYVILDQLGDPRPSFELGLRWLQRQRPSTVGETVVHGDFRLGNLLVDTDGLAGVLDWELAHVGDPAEDLGWFCVRAWRFGSPHPAGGVGTREELLAAYEAAGGTPIPLDTLRWWEVLGTLRWGVICIMQASVHLSGLVRSVELATIGRRVCENEWDVLGLLPGAPLVAADEVVAEPPGTGLHGRPTALELIEAVREWVDTDVRAATEGRVSFHARVAANALRIVERELAQRSGPAEAHVARLQGLGCDDDAELARRIRAGELDDRFDEVRAVLAHDVEAKLRVANPSHLQPDG